MADPENNLIKDSFTEKVRSIHLALQIPSSIIRQRNLPLHAEASELIEVAGDPGDKIHKLIPAAASAWTKMQSAAKTEGISLILVSGFRGLEYQRALIEKKLARGQSITEILSLLAPPGYSEHHTGRAVDLTTENCPPCVERFENTDAFSWLNENAQNFGFQLSYPRDNPYGFIYEPWHWAFQK